MSKTIILLDNGASHNAADDNRQTPRDIANFLGMALPTAPRISKRRSSVSAKFTKRGRDLTKQIARRMMAKPERSASGRFGSPKNSPKTRQGNGLASPKRARSLKKRPVSTIMRKTQGALLLLSCWLLLT
jgi:hypothetical protein